jgi:hypothetical protein
VRAALPLDFWGLETASFEPGIDFSGEFAGFPFGFPLFPNSLI